MFADGIIEKYYPTVTIHYEPTLSVNYSDSGLFYMFYTLRIDGIFGIDRAFVSTLLSCFSASEPIFPIFLLIVFLSDKASFSDTVNVGTT